MDIEPLGKILGEGSIKSTDNNKLSAFFIEILRVFRAAFAFYSMSHVRPLHLKF